MGRKLGDIERPLLVSVRSGAPVSMPGMMDTVLNLGINDDIAEALAQQTGNPRWAYDTYRRFIQMFASVVMGLEHDDFEHALEAYKTSKNIENDTDMTVRALCCSQKVT